jgi:hypothetical protein
MLSIAMETLPSIRSGSSRVCPYKAWQDIDAGHLLKTARW